MPHTMSDVTENDSSISFLGSSSAFTVIPLNETNWTKISLNEVVCHNWQDAQHTLFQLGSLCMAFSFLTPSNFKYHLLFLRCLLLFAFLFFILWAGLFICMPDIFGWNMAFFLINVGHIGYLGYSACPVKFHKELEDTYNKLFKPLGVSRLEFHAVTQIGHVVYLKRSHVYAVEGVTSCGEKISLLMRGRLKATYEHMFLHYIGSNEFLDSPEYEYSSSWGVHEKYQVTLVSIEESCIFSWQCSSLRTFLREHPFLSTVFHNLLGKDITGKLYQMQELLLSNPDYMVMLASRQSSMVNIRNSLVTQNSCSSLSKLASHSAAELSSDATPEGTCCTKDLSLLTYETSV